MQSQTRVAIHPIDEWKGKVVESSRFSITSLNSYKGTSSTFEFQVRTWNSKHSNCHNTDEGDNMKGTLHCFCGKMAAGKSTMSKELAKNEGAILISEDDWLAHLYPDEVKCLSDYIQYSKRLKTVLEKHVRQLLLSGVSVVLDFPGNTRSQREWFKKIFDEDNIPHVLHYIEVSDELCLKQLGIRNRDKLEGAAFTTEEEFYQITSYFQPPNSEEGFNTHVHTRE